MRNSLMRLIALCLSIGVTATCLAAPKDKTTIKEKATDSPRITDFPPGVFTDGGSYRYDDFKGKILVLFLYEQDCPSCRGQIPERNAMMARFRDKPVKFIAVAAGDSLADAKMYAKTTGLMMPTFADPFSLMEKDRRYTPQPISLMNIYQMPAIMPDGSVRSAGLKGERLDDLVDKAKWKYKDGGYNPKLAGAIELLEWNQYEAGMKLLRAMRKDSNKDVAASAEKLYEAVKTEAADWKSEADAAVAEQPAVAFDLFTRLKNCFPDEEATFGADAALKMLKTNKNVLDEQAARKQFVKMSQAMANAKYSQKGEVQSFCESIAKQYPDTPTGKRAKSVAELMGK